MSEFIWSMSISFQLLFIIISGVFFLYLKEKSFKYYALYNIFLVIYVLSRYDPIYDGSQELLAVVLGGKNAAVLMHITSFLVQVAFYIFYTIFALYFLDLDKHDKKFFGRIIWLLRLLGSFFVVLGILCFFIKNEDLFIDFYIFLYVPVMLSLFLPSVYRAIKFSGKHKDYFLIGASSFVFCALTAFTGSFVSSLNMNNPIIFFYIGIIVETIFFSLGLAFKMKLINDERNKIRAEVIKHKHRQQISRFSGLLQGEEKERKRMAEELHDGIAGDLTAIKFQLSTFNIDEASPKNAAVIQEVSNIINNSYEQIREISHNLSPSSIINYGLRGALENFCQKIGNNYKMKFDCDYSGEKLELSKTVQVHIYRIIQELVNNMVKHAGATEGKVEITYHKPALRIVVKDNGKGFSTKEINPGIGLSNIDSRIRFLNAKFVKENVGQGSKFIIDINTDQVPDH